MSRIDDFYVRDNCRLCGGKDLTLVLELTPTPPANEFVTFEHTKTPQDVFDLNVHECMSCGHMQLLTVVDPNRLFKNYVYVSGTSKVFVDHFRKYADHMVQKFNLKKGDLVVEIGSNDGTMLRFFKDLGLRVIGVDPAEKIAFEATESGIETWPWFFDRDCADEIIEKHGNAKLVIANNVFAHVDDLNGLTDGISALIKGGGSFVFEVSYLVDVIEKCLFDTIYHEHLAYHTIQPLIPFFKKHGLEFWDAEKIDTHGGSLRGFVSELSDSSHEKVSCRLRSMVSHEKELGFISGVETRAFLNPMKDLEIKINSLKDALTKRLHELKASGKKICAFGAPAKATTLMYHFGIDKNTIDFVVDDSPYKDGLFTPGTHIPVCGSYMLHHEKPDYALILAWNFADSIMRQQVTYIIGGGTFMVPIPNLVEFNTVTISPGRVTI